MLGSTTEGMEMKAEDEEPLKGSRPVLSIQA
jgi:hypothetical protein